MSKARFVQVTTRTGATWINVAHIVDVVTPKNGGMIIHRVQGDGVAVEDEREMQSVLQILQGIG
ncbi:MAG: hypothetical protein ABI843_07525 [Dokdonella sp.]